VISPSEGRGIPKNPWLRVFGMDSTSEFRLKRVFIGERLYLEL
jgi:hypothetical protein